MSMKAAMRCLPSGSDERNSNLPRARCDEDDVAAWRIIIIIIIIITRVGA